MIHLSPIYSCHSSSLLFQDLSFPVSPSRPIHLNTYSRDPTYPQHHPRHQQHHNYNHHNHNNHPSPRSPRNMPVSTTRTIHIQRPPQSPSGTNYHYHQPTSPQYQTQRRTRDSYSQPPFQSPTTPTTPPPPWATQQAAPKRVSKLSEIGGGGLNFGTNYTLPRRGGSGYGGRPQHNALVPRSISYLAPVDLRLESLTF